MVVDRIWSAAELEALTPDVRAATIRAGFVNDPSSVPADLIDAARRKADARVSATEGRQAASDPVHGSCRPTVLHRT